MGEKCKEFINDVVWCQGGGRRYNVALILRKTGVWMAGNANLTQKTIKKCQFICPNGRKGVIIAPDKAKLPCGDSS